jgi:putative transposase
MMYPNTFYHIYNRGNQRQRIYLQDRNYTYFLEKVRRVFINEISDIDLIAFCLMPNHFHLMAYTSDGFKFDSFSRRLAIMLRSYTRGVQVQQHFVGSLFQQNTRKKVLQFQQDAFNCFQYIHQNPVKADLVTNLEHWEYSSFNEYLFSAPNFCNVKLGRELLSLPSNRRQFYSQSKRIIKGS